MDYIEKGCIYKHQGESYENGGAVVNEQHATAYLKVDREHVHSLGVVTDWHGRTLGSARITARWPRYSFVSSHMHQVEAKIDGITYTGRCAGSGMIWQGKRKVNQSEVL